MTVPLLQPSPDWNMVLLVWKGTHLDGSPATGSIELKYNGTGPMLDPDPTSPMSVFVNPIKIPISTTMMLIEGEMREVGFCQVRVPASNDPDIEGGGGSYSFTEKLTKGGGRTGVSFLADKDAPGGVIYLNTLAGGTPTPGEPLSVVTVGEFDQLTGRVATLEANPGGGVSDYNDLENVPATFPTTAANVNDATTVGRSVLTASSATAARTAIGAGTSSLQLGTGPTTAKAGDYQPAWTDVTSKPTTFAPTIGSTSGTAVAGNDTRLSDARDTTTSRITDATTVGRSVVTAADAAGVRTVIGAGISNLALGTTGTTAAAGNDSRLSDARTPVAHSAALVTSGTLDAARIADGSLSQAKVSGLATALGLLVLSSQLANTNLTYAAASALGSRPTVPSGTSVRIYGATRAQAEAGLSWMVAGDYFDGLTS